MYGIKAQRQAGAGHLNLRAWYVRKRKASIDAQIRGILDLHRPVRKISSEPCHAISLPSPIWGCKSEARAGDTVYLGCNNSIRAFTLSALHDTELGDGRVTIASPIGQALLGRHQGDVVHLATLEGEVDYAIFKIV
jgi:hypothetical protein